MAEVTIRITTENSEDARRAVEGVTRALRDMGVEAEVVSSATEGVSESTAEAERSQSSFGDKIKSLTGFFVKHLAAAALFEAVTKNLGIQALKLTTVMEGTRAAVAGLSAKFTGATASAAKFLRVGVTALRLGLIALAAVITTKVLVATSALLDRMGQLGASAAIARQAFNNLTKQIGTTGDVLLQRLRVATLGTANDLDLMRQGIFALSVGVAKSTVQFEEMARLATLLGLAVEKDAAESMELFTGAIARNSIVTLKQLNLVVDTSEAHEVFAKKIGKTVEQLTEQQKITARTVAVMEQARKVVAQQGIETDNLKVVNLQAAAASESLRQAFQAEVAESRHLIGFRRDLLGLTIELQKNIQTLAPAVGVLADTFGLMKREMLSLITGPTGQFRQSLDRDLAQAARESDSAIAKLARTINELDESLRLFGRVTLARLGLADLGGADLETELGQPLREAISKGIREGFEEFEKQVQAAGEIAAELGEIDRLPPLPTRATREALAVDPGLAGVRNQLRLVGEEITNVIDPFDELGQLVDGLNEGVEGQVQAWGRFAEAMVVARMGVEETDLSFGSFSETLTKAEVDAIAISQTIRVAVIGAFTDLATGIGEALAPTEGVFASFGARILSIIGSMMQALGQALIAIGVAGLAIQQFVINPFLAIGAGIALIALGGVLRSTATGIVRQGASALVGGGTGGGFRTIGTPGPDFGNQRNVTIQIVARDLDRAGAERIIEELNITEQLDRPIRLETSFMRIP